MRTSPVWGESYSRTPEQEFEKVFVSARTTYGDIACCHLSAIKNANHLIPTHTRSAPDARSTSSSCTVHANRGVDERRNSEFSKAPSVPRPPISGSVVGSRKSAVNGGWGYRSALLVRRWGSPEQPH